LRRETTGQVNYQESIFPIFDFNNIIGNTRTRDGKPFPHGGIDLWGVVGTPIFAQFDGVISGNHPNVPHLHLETRVNGDNVNPTQFLNATVAYSGISK